MKGVILAGGLGTRLEPLTYVTNKHLLPIYNYPMIYFPVFTLKRAGITDVLVVSGPGHAGHFLNLLGSGKRFGMHFRYDIQDEAGGIAQALGLAEDFADNDAITVILGDNIFQDDFSKEIAQFERGAQICLKEVPDAKRFGVAEIAEEQVISIEEKPEAPKSNYAVSGLYIYDRRVFDIIKTLKPSNRGELEITDVNNQYIAWGEMKWSLVKGFWSDAGTFESLFRAASFVRQHNELWNDLVS
ncbi:MAG: sugar phosphate nucleotidyltransferase [Candidatus Hodarchaeales archaeon]|jgi:glucose-1-phosphate thymidylyltransferase